MFSFLKKVLNQTEISNQPETQKLKVAIDLDKNTTTAKFHINNKEVFSRTFQAFEFSHKRFDDKLVIQLCNSKSKDGGMLYFIDMKKNIDIFCVLPEFGWESNFIFKNERLSVKTKYGTFRITNDGKLENRVEFLRANIEATTQMLVQSVRELFTIQDNSESDIKYYLLHLDEYINKNEQEFHALNFLSSAYKLKGEIFQHIEDYGNAYSAYKIALELDQRCGVKRNINKVSAKLENEIILERDIDVEKYTTKIIELNKKIREKETIST